MNIKTYCNEHITTYKINASGYNIMLDFNGKFLTKEDVSDVDIIFLSHEHMDHFKSLLDYDLVKYLKKDIKIFSSNTTKLLIEYISNKYITSHGFNKAPTEYIRNLISNTNQTMAR